MSFGGAFGGFGSSNNNNATQSGTGFGGFGSSTNNNNNNNNSGGLFGSANNTGFGATNNTNTGGGLFGNTGSNSGSTFGGFGANNTASSGFGAKPAFGATTGNTLFGGNNTNTNTGTTSTFGGFGTNNNNTANTGFGSSTSGGLFGNTQAKPAFGATTTTTAGGLFGGGTTTGTNTNTFGASTTGFGSSTGGFGASQTVNQGTGTVPFAAHSEKDAASSSSSNYQVITCMQPYQNFSFEELRVADYNANRKYGNGAGQTTGFGATTGFGGFGTSNNTGFGANNSTGSTGGGLFGNNNATATAGFGATQAQPAATTGFGGGGLFGAKPAGGLFGNTNTSTTGTGLFGNTTQQTQPAASGGLFGNNNAFGANNATTNTTGGGLFGNNNNNTNNQPKPFGGFGTNTNTATTGFGTTATTGFGATNQNNPTPSLFGNNTNTANNSLFGGAQQTNTGFGGGFGATQNQNTAGNSLFGGNNNQAKPGLFGTNTTSTWGSNNNTNTTQANSLFGGSANNSQAGSSLFGQKPAGTSLFGGTNTNTTTSLFGGANNNQAQAQSTGLFGGVNNNQQKSLFGNSTNNAGNSLFGGSINNNTNGASLFGNSQQNNNAFGTSQQQAQPHSLTASLLQNPYGNDQLFMNLGTPTASVGPVATPLSGAQKPAKRAHNISAFKINPTASMRLITPQKRPSGYGFTYSTYGTPGSAQSFTPSLFASSNANRPSLSKSVSTSNLRASLTNGDDGILAAGAFTPNYRPYTSGSIRRLKIYRNLRTDLFGSDPERATKRVSFDNNNNTNNNNTNNNNNNNNNNSNSNTNSSKVNGTSTPGPQNALVHVNSSPNDHENEDHSNGSGRSNENNGRPEMEQVRGNELAIVPEHEQVNSSQSTKSSAKKSLDDQEPGEYYMSPSMQELRDMSRDELKNIAPLIVGRVGIGKIEFEKVDLTSVPIDQIFGDIVKLNVRSATVYETGVNTPPEGKGLNVPSTITLENSWPRSNGGRLPVHERKGLRFDKHIERLKRVGGTEFISYSSETGEWVFRVQHFTTYELSDEDEDETMADRPSYQEDSTTTPTDSAGLDDTFEYKKTTKMIPGGFDQIVIDDPTEQEINQSQPRDSHDNQTSTKDSTLRSADPVTPESVHHSDMEDSLPENRDVVGAYPDVKSILKTNNVNTTPSEANFRANDDWAEHLQRTVSPRKQDRRALREMQSNFSANDKNTDNAAIGQFTGGPQAFNTTFDIMNSLWNQPRSGLAKSQRNNKGFEWPYSKKSNNDMNLENLDDMDRAFHQSVKPNWSTIGEVVYVTDSDAKRTNDGLYSKSRVSFNENNSNKVEFAKPKPINDTINKSLDFQLDNEVTKIQPTKENIPRATTEVNNLYFTKIASIVENDNVTCTKERHIWLLAAILFDPVQISCQGFVKGVQEKDLKKYENRIRRDAVLDLWRQLTRSKALEAVREASTPEEKAIHYLSCGDIESACVALVDGRNFRLATLISQLPSNPSAKEALQKQIEDWRKQNSLSEFPIAIRALYEIVAGNCCLCAGKAGASEDRAQTFGIAEHFNLDWKRALGLRLWYGSDDLSSAIQMFADDLSQTKEKVDAISETVDDWTSKEKEQDALLILLRLYADKSKVDTKQLLSFVSFSGNPINARLTWQLATLFHAKELCQFTPSQLDDITLSFAAQLEAQNSTTSVCTAIKILLHLSEKTCRSHEIQSLLDRQAALLLAPNLTLGISPFDVDQSKDEVLQFLSKSHIPPSWLYKARAQYCFSALKDSFSQAANLVLAFSLIEAHDLLCRSIGPEAVISRDFTNLRILIQKLTHASTNETSGDGQLEDRIERAIPLWKTGGQVYADYIQLVDLLSSNKTPSSHNTSTSKETLKMKSSLLGRLVKSLPVMKIHTNNPPSSTSKHPTKHVLAVSCSNSLVEKVAVSEIGKLVRAEIKALYPSSLSSTDVSGGKDDAKEREKERQKMLKRLPGPEEEGYVRQGVKVWGLFGTALRV